MGIEIALTAPIKRMLRKFTALCLLSLMMVVVATGQGTLRYCLCLQEIYSGDCDCCLELVETDSCAEDSCSSHCHEQLDSASEVNVHLSENDDCSVTLSVKLDDHVNPSINLTLAGGGEHFAQPQSPDSGLKFAPNYISAKNGKRGPPGAAYFPDSVPFRIRHSVFRL